MSEAATQAPLLASQSKQHFRPALQLQVIFLPSMFLTAQRVDFANASVLIGATKPNAIATPNTTQRFMVQLPTCNLPAQDKYS
jgi:hypothetical protein